MKCYIIPPINHLSLTHKGDSYYVLAHLYLRNVNYRMFFKKRVKEGKFVTLDNSAAERSLVTEDKLIEIVKDLMPNEVIAPDVLFDKQTTLDNLDRFISRMASEDLLNKVEIFACPQGNTQEEWLECYREMLCNKYVKVIGLSKIAVPYCWYNQSKDDKNIAEARQICVKYLDIHGLIMKPLHLLGMGDCHEYSAYKHKLLRSTDSCYTVLSAINNIQFKEGKIERIKTTNDYFDTVMTKQQIKLAEKNIKYLKRILRKVN